MPVTGFEINRNPGNVTRTVSGSVRSFKETGLANRTPYTFRVRTIATNGTSDWVTAPAVVPAA